jgi:hypothetical protein
MLTVKVTNLYNDDVRSFEGDEAQVLAQLHHHYHWTDSCTTVQDAVERISRAQAYQAQLVPGDPMDELDKAANTGGERGREHVVHPVGTVADGYVKVKDQETGREHWRQVEAGMVMDPNGNPTSARNPGGK